MSDIQRLMRVGEVADYLDCSVRHVWNLIARGDLPAYRIGAITRLRVYEVDGLVAAGLRESRP